MAGNILATKLKSEVQLNHGRAKRVLGPAGMYFQTKLLVNGEREVLSV